MMYHASKIIQWIYKPTGRPTLWTAVDVRCCPRHAKSVGYLPSQSWQLQMRFKCRHPIHVDGRTTKHSREGVKRYQAKCIIYDEINWLIHQLE